jgi:ATP/maltotriose-dependent transcriptional regulator MalT
VCKWGYAPPSQSHFSFSVGANSRDALALSVIVCHSGNAIIVQPIPMGTHTPIPILSPKLQIPPCRPQLVSRERLLEVLSGGIYRKLTLISAPAGYGKTTLLGEWAAQSEWRLAWITLAKEDNDTDRFLTYLVTAVQTTEANFSSLDGFFGTRFSPQPMPLDALLAILVNELSSVGERLVIVLDDYHFIDHQEIHRFLNDLLDNLPTNIQSPGLCNAAVEILDRDEKSHRLHQSRQILEFLDASNLFVVPLDSQRQWYRFHPLFADFLRDRLMDQHES